MCLTASCLPIHCSSAETQNIGETLVDQRDDDQGEGGDAEDGLLVIEKAEDEDEDEDGADRRLDCGYKILERKACS